MMPARVKPTTTGWQCQSINADEGTIHELHVVMERIITVFCFREYTEIKEQMYQDKLAQLKKQLQQLRDLLSTVY
jgi:hypothetical protein